MSSSLFGWDLLIKSVESEIKTNEDILLCFTHLVLVSNDFKCIGLGESKILDGSETKTEALPPGWTESYSIRYVHQGRLYLLKATKVDDGLMLNLIRVDERTTSLVQLNTALVASRTGILSQMLPKHADILQQIKTELIDKIVVSKNTKDNSSQTPTVSNPPPTSPQASPLFVDPMSRAGPVGVGEYDLNPFGRNPLAFPAPMGGGGMLFEPPRGGRYPQGPGLGMPPGAVPPGARFDPFRPPDVDRFPRRPNNRPDNDEFPPPGYDDMFM
ncbi:proteasome inhibitor PI31 subunit-like [Tribolium madens]|uniref:proteasome inhibitor PI31 subunit-like n=1 Tax=Tribolium madens TaxID=41895 RepID=UPI001CF74EA1|nr:proteasome inhibitor PI31 subunit-like [Tribolium madens]